jgi:hypothetical protein
MKKAARGVDINLPADRGLEAFGLFWVMDGAIRGKGQDGVGVGDEVRAFRVFT